MHPDDGLVYGIIEILQRGGLHHRCERVAVTTYRGRIFGEGQVKTQLIKDV